MSFSVKKTAKGGVDSRDVIASPPANKYAV